MCVCCGGLLVFVSVFVLVLVCVCLIWLVSVVVCDLRVVIGVVLGGFCCFGWVCYVELVCV